MFILVDIQVFQKEQLELETSVIFCNALAKVVFKFRSAIKIRICVSSQFLSVFSYLQKEKKICRRLKTMNSSSSIFMMYFISHLRCGRRVAGAVKTTLGIYLFFFLIRKLYRRTTKLCR